MNKWYSILCTLFFATTAFGQGFNQTDEAQIKALIVESFDEVWATLDSRKIGKYYSKDFLLLENGEVWNNDSISTYLDNAILKQPIPHRENSIEFIEVEILNGMAWVAYKNEAIFSRDGTIVREAQWLESAVAVFTEDGWKLKMLHSTRTKNVR